MNRIYLQGDYVIHERDYDKFPTEEDYLIHLVKQSKYLTLLKEDNIYHLRIEKGLDPGKLMIEKDFALWIIRNHKFKFDEDLSYRKSGDINRSVISVGTLIN